jgi:hypothetical protein
MHLLHAEGMVCPYLRKKNEEYSNRTIRGAAPGVAHAVAPS